jgi:hypothetical protein
MTVHAVIQQETNMTVERWIRLIAGSFILISLGLARWVNPNWLWFTAFVGANLLQSSITRWCLMEDILKKVGVGTAQAPSAR